MRDLADAIRDGMNVETGITTFTDEEHNQAIEEIIEELDTKIIEKQRELQTLKGQKDGILNNTEEGLQRTAPSVSSLLDKAMHTFLQRKEGKDQPVPLPWPSIADKLKGGLWPGLHILVGNTGSGKSQWALQAAHHAAKQGWPVLYIALELGATDLIARLLGLETGIPWSQIWHGESQALSKIQDSKAAERVKALPIRQASVPPYGWSYDQLWELTEAMTKEHPENKPPFVILDFMQLVASPKGKHEDLRQRIQKTAYAARFIARELSSSVLLISSTSREKYATLDGRDKGFQAWEQSASFLVGYGKESGEIEYAADGVLTLVKKPWEGTEPPKEGSTVYLGIAKRRAGPSGAWLPLHFDGSTFSEPYHTEISL